jgi:FtsP/CotA-like multicopper oxidase with cupredoxin domain
MGSFLCLTTWLDSLVRRDATIALRSRSYVAMTLAAVTLGMGFLVLTAARVSNKRVEVVDFGKTIRTTNPTFHARVAPASDADVKVFRIPITDATVEIAKGVTYRGWTFGGTVAGPVIRVRVGDEVRITVVNQSPMPHSIDFHARTSRPALRTG